MVRRKSSRMAVCLMSILLVIISTLGMGTVAVSAAETNVQASEAGGATAVLNNSAGWSTCYVYYWGNSGNVNNKAWPGEQLTDAQKNKEGFYEVEIPASCLAESNGVIFHNNGSGKSADLDIAAGECKVYDNSKSSWTDYDTSAVKLSFTSDSEPTQFKGTDIVLNATATGGSGVYTYTFKANSTTIYTGSNGTCTWTPTTAGTYTVTVDVNDGQGNTNSKSMTFEIKDDATAAEPVLKGISTGYTNNQVPVNSSVAVNVNASGGKVGTNLLFYKVEVLSPSGNPVNTVYYKQSNILNFTPTQKGDYTVNVTVQNSYNADVKKSYTVKADTSAYTAPEISSFTASPSSVELGSSVTLKTTVTSGTANYTYAYTANGAAIKSQTTSATTNSVTWTPSTAGTYNVVVTVTDANNMSATKTITVKVTEPVEPEYIPGDVNGDKSVSVHDALYVIKSVNCESGYELTAGTNAYLAADMNKDNVISVIDVLAIMQVYLG